MTAIPRCRTMSYISPGVGAGGNAVLPNWAAVRGLLLDIDPPTRPRVPAAVPGPADLVLRLDDHVRRAAVPDVRPGPGRPSRSARWGACEFVPIVTVALVSGALADAFDRRLLVAPSPSSGRPW